MKHIELLCLFEFVFIVDVYMCCAWLVRWKEWYKVNGGTAGECLGMKRVGKRRGKVVWGKKSVSFYFCVTVSFTPSFPLFNPPSHYSSSHALTYSQSTPHHHAAQARMPVLSSFFLCMWLSVHSLHTQSNNNATQSCNNHTHGITDR